MGKNKEITKRINANGSPKQSSKNNGENQKQPSLDHQALGYNRSHVEALEKRLRIVEQQLRDKEALEAKVEENSQKYEKLNVELEQLKLKFERGSANGDNVVVSRSLLEALGIPREEAYPVHLLRDRFFELKLENRELKERFLQVTNKCDQPAEEEGGVLEIKTERLSHSPAEKFANLAGRISELEKELAEARANKQQNPNDTKQEVEEEEEKKNLQIEVQKRDFEVMKSELDATKSTMFVLQGQLATLLSMRSQLYIENVLLKSKLIECQCQMMISSSPPDFFTGDLLFSSMAFPSPPPSLELAIEYLSSAAVDNEWHGNLAMAANKIDELL